MLTARGGPGQRRAPARRFIGRWHLLHPFLVAAYPAVFLFAQNADQQMTLDPLWLPLAASLSGSAAVFAILWLAFRDPIRSGLATSLIALLFFGYGHASNLTAGLLDSDAVLLTVWSVALLIGCVAIARSGAVAPQIARALTVVAALGVAGNGLGAAAQVLDVGIPGEVDAAAAGTVEIDGLPAARPDVYYLIFDRYAGPDVLKRLYGFDNSEFLDALASRGFYVAEESRTNYLRTSLSLVSSLSMDYLDAEQLQAEEASPGGGSPIDSRLRGHLAVPQTLRQLGYRYIHIGGLWEPTATNVDADVTLRYAGYSQFADMLVETTILRLLTPETGPTEGFSATNLRRHSLYQFERLLDSRDVPGPTFVYAHFVLPHPPYAFDSDGSFPSESELRRRGNDESYVRQLQYTNGRILEVIDRLLSSGNDPVILLQADEGPWPDRFRANKDGFQWMDATRDELEEKLAILNAYHLPGVSPEAAGLYPAITPVNSFRVVFNAVFGADLSLLPDRYYAQVDALHFYDLFEVTDRLRN